MSACVPQTVHELSVRRVFVTCSTVCEHESFQFVEFGVFCLTRFARLPAPCRLSEVLARTVRVGARVDCRLWRFCSNLRPSARLADCPQALADCPPKVCQIWLNPCFLRCASALQLVWTCSYGW
jgi:hypothetical protein